MAGSVIGPLCMGLWRVFERLVVRSSRGAARSLADPALEQAIRRLERPPARDLPSLDDLAVLWVAAIDRVPIGERIEWVAKMKAQVDEINAARADA